MYYTFCIPNHNIDIDNNNVPRMNREQGSVLFFLVIHQTHAVFMSCGNLDQLLWIQSGLY